MALDDTAVVNQSFAKIGDFTADVDGRLTAAMSPNANASAYIDAVAVAFAGGTTIPEPAAIALGLLGLAGLFRSKR